jgi:hypothetical protein
MKHLIQMIKKYFTKQKSFSSDFSDALNESMKELGKEMGIKAKKKSVGQ